MPSFASPELLLLGVPLVGFIAWRIANLPRSLFGLRRRVAQAAMLLAALAAAAAVARLEFVDRVDRVATLFVVDRSRSVERSESEAGDAILSAIRTAIDGMHDDDLAGLVVFGAEAATEILPRTRPAVARFTAPIARDGTDIEAAIRHALADLPAEAAPKIVLVSDGVETQGDALAGAQAAAVRGVVIDIWPIEREPSAEIAVERLIVPASAGPDEPVEIRIVTRSTERARVRVRVQRDEQPIAETETDLERGTDVLVLRDRTSEPGIHRYEAQIERVDDGVDTSVENNVGGALLRISGRSRVLVLSDRPPEAEALVTAIAAAGLEVVLGDATSAPLTLAEFASFDLVILSDLGARSLTNAQMTALRSYVRDVGGGLLMLGGRDAFGLGGYARTPVEDVLPATFNLRERRDRASLAMVIAIDRSGSMTAEVSPGVTKLDLANEAAARSAALLSPMDRIAVAHVDTDVSWTLPMLAVESPEALSARIRRAGPGGGGIYVDVALEAAYAVLRAQNTQLKHLLLFSDGSDSEAMTRARALVSAAAADGITTSVVSMGVGTDTPELEVLSRLGSGRFYVVENMAELPIVFTQETITASRSAIVEESVQVTVGAPSDILQGIDFASAPALDGYVVVEARPRASVHLGVLREQEESTDPLLATWRIGVGRSAVLTTDAGGRYARPWLRWPGHGPLLGQLARALCRGPESGGARLDVSVTGNRGTIRLDAVDQEGRYRDHVDFAATISGPGGVAQETILEQTGPGRYEARFEAATPGPYLATVREIDRDIDEDGEGVLVGTAGIVRGRGDELRGEGTNHALLARIAAATGGRVRRDLRDVFRERPPPTLAHRPLWRELVLGSMWLLLVSVALRRLELPDPARAWLARLSRAHSSRRSSPFATSAEERATGALEPPTTPTGRDHAPAPPPDGVLHGGPASTTSHDGAVDRMQAASTDDAREDRPATLAENLLARKKRRR